MLYLCTRVDEKLYIINSKLVISFSVINYVVRMSNHA